MWARKSSPCMTDLAATCSANARVGLEKLANCLRGVMRDLGMGSSLEAARLWA